MGNKLAAGWLEDWKAGYSKQRRKHNSIIMFTMPLPDLKYQRNGFREERQRFGD